MPDKSCSAIYNNKKHVKRQPKKRFCRECKVKLPIIRKTTTNGIPYIAKRLLCDTCRKPKAMTLREAMYINLHKSSAFALVRARARSKMAGITICTKCGYSKHVEVCHIKHISSFPLDTLISDINANNNLLVLCPNCHWEFDHDL